MSDKIYGEIPHMTALRYWAFGQMLRGFGWAAAFSVALGVIFLVIWGVSLLLPQASKEAPSPYNSQLEISTPLILTA